MLSKKKTQNCIIITGKRNYTNSERSFTTIYQPNASLVKTENIKKLITHADINILIDNVTYIQENGVYIVSASEL